MLKSIVRFTILLAMAFSHNALASKHADEIIKLN
jgi:hypothetical protein